MEVGDRILRNVIVKDDVTKIKKEIIKEITPSPEWVKTDRGIMFRAVKNKDCGNLYVVSSQNTSGLVCFCNFPTPEYRIPDAWTHFVVTSVSNKVVTVTPVVGDTNELLEFFKIGEEREGYCEYLLGEYLVESQPGTLKYLLREILFNLDPREILKTLREVYTGQQSFGTEVNTGEMIEHAMHTVALLNILEEEVLAKQLETYVRKAFLCVAA